MGWGALSVAVHASFEGGHHYFHYLHHSLMSNEVTQSCPTLCDPMDWGLPGFSVHGIFPGKDTGVGCHFLLQGISQPKDQTWVSHIVSWRFTLWATREATTIVLPQVNNREGTQSTHRKKIGLKIHWAWPSPSEDLVSLSHQEASISLLAFSIREQTDWKPQSQKTNQSDHMNHSLVWLNKTMSHAM